MPDATFSAAIREAYASAPVNEVILHTLELWHDGFTDPIRVVRDAVPLDAKIEATAPRDPGAVVTFTAMAFDLTPPEVTTEGLARCKLEFDNVSREIGAALDLAVIAGGPITVIYRAYLADEAMDGPENDPPLTLTLSRVVVTPLRVSAEAGFPDLLNRSFPGEDYDLDRFPGLANE